MWKVSKNVEWLFIDQLYMPVHLYVSVFILDEILRWFTGLIKNLKNLLSFFFRHQIRQRESTPVITDFTIDNVHVGHILIESDLNSTLVINLANRYYWWR